MRHVIADAAGVRLVGARRQPGPFTVHRPFTVSIDPARLTADDTAHPPLWIAKDPYCPTAIVEAAILAAIRLSGQSAKPHPDSRFLRTGAAGTREIHPDSQAGAA